MKKMLLCFMVFISCMLFFYSYDSYNLMNYARILNISNQMSNNKQYCNLSFINIDKKQDVLRDLVQFSIDNDIQFSLHDTPMTDDGTVVYCEYIYTLSNDWIYNSIQMKSGDKIDFTNINEAGYLSSDANDLLASGRYTSYDNSYFARETEVIQLRSVKDVGNLYWEQTYLVTDSQYNAEKLVNYLNQKYEKDIVMDLSYPHGGTEQDILGVYKTNEILLIVICGFCISFLILVCIISKDKREIIIRRMNGQNIFLITIQLYLKMLVLAYCVFVFMLTVMWFIFVGEYNSYYHELFSDVKMYCIYGIIFVLVLLVLASLYIKNTTNVLELKNSQSAKRMLYVNYVIKIGMSIILATPFIVNLTEAIPHIQKYKYIMDNEDKLMNFYKIANVERMKENGKKEIMQYPYCNMEEYGLTRSPYFIEGMDSSEIEDYVMNTPLVVANEAFLKDYELYDENNERIDLTILEHKTLIIPSKWKGKELKPENKYTSNHQIYVQSTGTIDNLSVGELFFQLDEPVILFVNEFEEYSMDHVHFFLPKTKQKDREYYEKELSQYAEYFVVNTSNRDVRYNLGKVQTQVIDLLTKIVLYFVLYSLFVVQYIMLYIQDYRKELSVKYMLGQSKWNRYGDMFIVNLCICLVTILIGVLINYNSFIVSVQFTGLIFLFDSFIMLLFIKLFERKSIVLSLKGEY